MIAAAIVLIVLAGLLLGLARTSKSRRSSQVPEETWEAARAGEDSQVGRVLLSVARPLSSAVAADPQSALHRAIASKIAAAGGRLFAGSVDVFISVQVAALLCASGILVAIPLLGLSGAGMIAAALVAVAVAALPYNRLHEQAGKRLAAVRAELPEFAELLLMPVTSSYGIIPALDFTAKRSHGIVAAEVQTLISQLSTRAENEAEAFRSCGARLGDPAAITFFNSLYQAYTDGVPIADSLRGQAAQLRHQEHQSKRAALKKLPTKLVLMIAMHLLPFLFVITALPTLFAMRSM